MNTREIVALANRLHPNKSADPELAAQGIVYEVGGFYVKRFADAYSVFEPGITCAESKAAFPSDADGLSLAIVYCRHLYETMVRKLAQGGASG